ncbi:MAG: DNA ligase, partial [Candidatus Bathyarchaeia archaeon]
MRYSLVAETYERIEGTTKRLEMTDILVDLIRQTPSSLIDKLAYLTQGKLYPDFMGVEIGMAEKMAIASIAEAAG